MNLFQIEEPTSEDIETPVKEDKNEEDSVTKQTEPEEPSRYQNPEIDSGIFVG